MHRESWLREKARITFLDVANARVHCMDIGAQHEELAAPASHAGCVIGPAAEDAPRFAGGLAGLGDRFDRVQTFRIFEVTGHAKDLAEVGRADEQEVDVRYGGDLTHRFKSAGCLDLNS